MNNSFVQLVEVDRSKLDAIDILIAPIVAKMKDYFARCNDIIFIYPDSFFSISDLWDINVVKTANLKLRIQAFPYSAIGVGATFDIDFGKRTFTPLSIDADELDESDVCSVQ